MPSSFWDKCYDFFVKGFNNTFIVEDRYLLFLKGIGNTLLVALVATVIGVIIGCLVALVKTVHKQNPKNLKILNWICELYTTVIRGTPVVVQLLITYNIIFRFSTHAVLIGMIGFGLNSGAYVSEIIRAGINAVDIGQTEAGRSLGLSKSQTLFKIVLPQAVKAVLPTYTSEFIVLIKETSVASFIAVMDMTKAGDMIRNATYNAWIPLLTCAVIYLILTLGLTKLFGLLEKRMAKSDRS